jgi:benzoyl-CoA reductase subunit B
MPDMSRDRPRRRAGTPPLRRLVRRADGVSDRNEQAAYVFVMGSLTEMLRTFDMPVVFPEINSLQTAVKKAAGEYLNEAEDHGFSPDVCGYVKADYALQLRGGEHPRGRIPPPAVAVLTNACNTYLKWAEIWERLYGTPVITVDVPGSRSGTQPERASGGASSATAATSSTSCMS